MRIVFSGRIIYWRPHSLIYVGESVRCYQCASSDDPDGEDNCGAYKKFVKEEHIPIECNSDESHSPGSFCMKITQQGPKGFICKQW